MNRKGIVDMQNEYIETLIKNLPILRAATSMTQAELADKVGVSRQTIVSIETRKRPMPWSLYLAIICVFKQYEETKKLLETFELFNSDFIKELKQT